MATTTCPSCTSDDLLAVVLAPRDVPMRFTTCRHCEHRWWQELEQGSTIALDGVIDHIRV